MILKVVSSNLTIRQYIYKKMMNYKDKKYLSEDRWLAENLDSFNFFFVAQLKACDSADWTNLQIAAPCSIAPHSSLLLI